MPFEKVTHRPAKIGAVLSHRESHPTSLTLNPSLALSRRDRRKFRRETNHTPRTTRSRRTTCTHFSCSRQRRDYYQPPYTHRPILRTSVVEGDYLRPCISTLTSCDDQTTNIFAPAQWSAFNALFSSAIPSSLLSKLSIHPRNRCKHRSFFFLLNCSSAGSKSKANWNSVWRKISEC